MKMNTRIFFIAFLAIFASLAFVSAASLAIAPLSYPQNVSHNAGSFTLTFELNNSGTADNNVDFSSSSVTGISGASISRPNVSIAQNERKVLTATITFPAYQTGTMSVNITADDEGAGTPKTFIVPINILSTPAISLTKIKDISVTQNGSISVTNTGNSLLSNINLSVSSGDIPISISENNFALASGASKIVSFNVADTSDIAFGNTDVTITAKDINSGQTSSLSSVFAKSFCEYGKAGNNLSMDISISSSGDDDEQWKPLDTITVDVDIENKGNDRVRDIFVKMGLFDSTGKDVSNDLDFNSDGEEEIDLGSLDEDETDTATFEFRVPADLNDGDYRLAIKIYGDNVGEKYECLDTSTDLDKTVYQTIKIEKESDEGRFITFEDTKISPQESTCGDLVTLTTDVYNVGDDEQDQVRVRLVNTKLGINLAAEIKKNMDSGDKETVVFSFPIPSNTAAGTYSLELNADYDYKRNDYGESTDETTFVRFPVLGCTSGASLITGNIVAINALLDSDAKAGKTISVKSTITNIANESRTFAIDVTDFESWAALNSVSSRLVTLAPGASTEVTISLKVKDGISGAQTFNIKAQSADKLTTRQVAVNVAGSSGWTLPSLGNTGLWIIGIVNVILIILIIVVAVRLSSRA